MCDDNSVEDKDLSTIPIPALMSKLSANTSERNKAVMDNKFLEGKARRLMDTQFKTYGRLVKYEPSVFEEVWKYAEDNSLMFKINSELIGEFSVIGDYTTKKKTTFKAHFTRYGKYLRKCEVGEQPISYEGYFPFSTFKSKLRLNKTNSKYECFEDFIEPKNAL